MGTSAPEHARNTDPPAAPGAAGAGRRNTAVLVAFTGVTNLADGIMKMALPLLAAQLTSSPAQVTAVSLTLTLPWLLTALHIGVLVDRYDRRGLLWLAMGVRLAAMGGLAGAGASGTLTLPLLLVSGAVLGSADVLAATSAAALVPAAVPGERRERANSWMVAAETVAQEFTGPAVGGLLLAAGTALALGVTGGAYALSALVLLLLIGRFRATPAQTGPPPSVHTRIAEGLGVIWHSRLLRTLSLLVAVLSAAWGAWLATMPLYARDVMGLEPQQYGLLLSALGIGGLLGAASVGRANRVLGPRWAMFADLIGTAAMVALPALTVNFWAVAAGAFLGGAGGTLWAVNVRGLAQRVVPDHLLGRYSAAGRLFAFGAMPLGAALAGVIGELAGMRAAFAVLAALVALTVVPFLRIVTASALAR